MAEPTRKQQIEAMLAEEPNDPFLRYGLAMEHASAGDDAGCAAVLADLIARHAADPYIPAYLQAGQALAARLEELLNAPAPTPGQPISHPQGAIAPGQPILDAPEGLPHAPLRRR